MGYTPRDNQSFMAVLVTTDKQGNTQSTYFITRSQAVKHVKEFRSVLEDVGGIVQFVIYDLALVKGEMQ